MNLRPYTQRDVRTGSVTLATLEKAQRLGRNGSTIRPLYEKWHATACQFVHQHAFADDCRQFIAQNPTLVKGIKVPKDA